MFETDPAYLATLNGTPLLGLPAVEYPAGIHTLALATAKVYTATTWEVVGVATRTRLPAVPAGGKAPDFTEDAAILRDTRDHLYTPEALAAAAQNKEAFGPMPPGFKGRYRAVFLPFAPAERAKALLTLMGRGERHGGLPGQRPATDWRFYRSYELKELVPLKHTTVRNTPVGPGKEPVQTTIARGDGVVVEFKMSKIKAYIPPNTRIPFHLFPAENNVPRAEAGTPAPAIEFPGAPRPPTQITYLGGYRVRSIDEAVKGQDASEDALHASRVEAPAPAPEPEANPAEVLTGFAPQSPVEAPAPASGVPGFGAFAGFGA